MRAKRASSIALLSASTFVRPPGSRNGRCLPPGRAFGNPKAEKPAHDRASRYGIVYGASGILAALDGTFAKGLMAEAGQAVAGRRPEAGAEYGANDIATEARLGDRRIQMPKGRMDSGD